jgi:hypothetical protein
MKDKKNIYFPVLKISIQCPLFLLVEVLLREVKALGSVKGKGSGF